MATESEVAMKDVERFERLAEEAYEVMYDARHHNVKVAFEDALANFDHAIAAARRAGLQREADRLTERSAHVSNVYNSQFRYI